MATNTEPDDDLNPQYRMHNRCTPPPINLLPTDILTQVFLDVCESFEGEDHDEPKHLPFRIQLTHVSHAWRVTALACASLWTTLYVRRHMPIEMLQFTWTNTGDALVDLDIKLRGFTNDDVCNFVADKIRNTPERFRSITSWMSKKDYAIVFRAVHGRFENLEALNVSAYGGSGRQPGEILVSIEAPRLRSVQAWLGIGLPWTSKLLRSPHLTKIALNDHVASPSEASWNAMLGLLAKSPSLQDLALKLPVGYTGSNFNFRHIGPVRLPNLRSVDISSYSHPALSRFLRSIQLDIGNLFSFSVGWNVLDGRPAGLLSNIHSALSGAIVYPEEIRFSWGAVHCYKVKGMSRDDLSSDPEDMGIHFTVSNDAATRAESPEHLFNRYSDYHDVWSFDYLASLTIDASSSIPDSLWCHLAQSSTLRVLDVKSSIPPTLLAVMDGSYVGGTDAPRSNGLFGEDSVDFGLPVGDWVPFPALEKLSLTQHPSTDSSREQFSTPITRSIIKREGCIRRRQLTDNFHPPRLTLIINRSTEEVVEKIRAELRKYAGYEVCLGAYNSL